MPELPEVETITRQLREKVLGQRVEEVEVLDPKLQRGELERIEGGVISSLWRRGKNIIFGFAEGLYLLAHLRMTGWFCWQRDKKPSPVHQRAILQFGQGKLYYVDQRRFGNLVVREDLNSLSTLGIEPLSPEFNGEYLYQRTQESRREIKVLLMDQGKIAGIGNIYASEILFSAGIHPLRQANTLTLREAERLTAGTKATLETAIRENGTTVANYRDIGGEEGGFQNLLQVYGREGKPCLVCGFPIERMWQSGRSTYFCPRCQGSLNVKCRIKNEKELLITDRRV